jgi:hypothetical protein
MPADAYRRASEETPFAHECDAAQARGEVATAGKRRQRGRLHQPPVATDVGLRKQEIHEARQVRDAEKRDPGIVAGLIAHALAISWPRYGLPAGLPRAQAPR